MLTVGSAGSFFSSTNEMAIIGRSILDYKLLTQAQTNRWLKPTSFVDEWSQGVGRPWEIFRRRINGQSVELYTKGGDWGVYHSLVALVPQYNVGFTILTAADPGPDASEDPLMNGIPNPIINMFLPAIDEIAKKQTAVKFGGRYSDKDANSSLTIGTDSNNTGLIVKEWISNGINVFEALGATSSDFVYRIMPNQLAFGKDKVGFTSLYETAQPKLPKETWYVSCLPWL
jgi:hypothetical protein